MNAIKDDGFDTTTTLTIVVAIVVIVNLGKIKHAIVFFTDSDQVVPQNILTLWHWPRLSFLMLRQSCATLLIEAGVKLKQPNTSNTWRLNW